MPTPAHEKMAQTIVDLERRLRAVERAPQARRTSLEVDGVTVTLPAVVRSSNKAAADAVEAQRVATVALETADGKNRSTFSIAAATSDTPGTSAGDLWFQRDASGVILGSWEWDGDSWEPRKFGDEVLNSLTVGKLVTGSIAAGQRIIAGPESGTHAELTSSGLRIFAEDPADGIPDEVIRLGTTTNDYFGIVNADGELITSFDDTGAVNGRTGNFREDITVGGHSILDLLGSASGSANGSASGVPGAQHYYGFAAAQINAVTTEIGLIEMSVEVSADRMYWIVPEVSYAKANVANELVLQVRDGGTAAPTITSTSLYRRQFSNTGGSGFDGAASSPGLWGPTVSGTHRLLLTAQGIGSGGVNITSLFNPTLSILDLGPKKPIVASVNRGGGGTPVPTKQYDTGWLTASGWVTYDGAGNLRGGSPTGPVQGWDPNGVYGNGKGYWWFPIPATITGTVDRVDFYAYAEWWNYNSGGSGRFNVVPTTQGGPNFVKLAAEDLEASFTKPGGRGLTLPASWYPFFRNGQANSISVGPGVGTDLNYSGRFHGPSAQIRVWYTQ